MPADIYPSTSFPACLLTFLPITSIYVPGCAWWCSQCEHEMVVLERADHRFGGVGDLERLAAALVPFFSKHAGAAAAKV